MLSTADGRGSILVGPARTSSTEELLRLVYGFRTTQALYVVEKRGVAVLLADAREWLVP